MKTSQIIILALVALLVVGVCAAGGVLLVRSLGDKATPTAVVEMTEVPVVPPSTTDSRLAVDD